LIFWAGLLCEKIQDITQSRGLCTVDFRVGAAIAGYRGEALVLHIEYLGKHPTGGTELVGIEAGISTFDALPVFVFHGIKPMVVAVLLATSLIGCSHGRMGRWFGRNFLGPEWALIDSGTLL